jgi:hypothetical protein
VCDVATKKKSRAKPGRALWVPELKKYPKVKTTKKRKKS